jgi:hypothetical protein
MGSGLNVRLCFDQIGIPLEKAELLRMRKRKVVPWDLKVKNNADSDTVAGNEWITDGWELDHQREEQERWALPDNSHSSNSPLWAASAVMCGIRIEGSCAVKELSL